MKVEGGKIKLSARERAAFFSRDWPELADSGKPPELAETHYQLSSRLSFTVVRIHRTKKGYRLEYDVIDDREEKFLMLPAAASFPTDERGHFLDDMPPEEEIGYTRNPKRKVVDDLPTVRPDVQNVLEMRAKLRDSEYDREHRAEIQTQRDLHRLNAQVKDLVKRAAKMGVDPLEVLAPISRTIEAQHEELSDAA